MAELPPGQSLKTSPLFAQLEFIFTVDRSGNVEIFTFLRPDLPPIPIPLGGIHIRRSRNSRIFWSPHHLVRKIKKVSKQIMGLFSLSFFSDVIHGSSCLFPHLQPEALAITEIALGKIEVNGDRGFQRDMPVHLIKNWMEVDNDKVTDYQAWKMCFRLRESWTTSPKPNVHTCFSHVDRVAGAVFISFGDVIGHILPPTTNSLLIPISVS